MGHARDEKKIFFGRNNKSRSSGFRKFLFYQNIICFDWVMNLFLSWVMFSVKKVPFPAKTAVLFLSNLFGSIVFLKTAGVISSCSFPASSQETISMMDSVFNKFCYVAKYKFHRRCSLSAFSAIFMLACRKIFSAFIRFYMKLFPEAMVSFLYHGSLNFPHRPSFPLLSYDLKTAWMYKFTSNKFLENTFWKCRSSLSHMFFKIDLLKNFTIYTRKHLCWNLFFIKV